MSLQKKIFVIIFTFFTFINLYSRGESERTLYLEGEINDSTSTAIIDGLLKLDSESDLPIRLIINSTGGNVYAMLGIYDTMRFVQSPVYTECRSKAASAAAIILATGKKGHRGAVKNSSIMIHRASLIDKTQDNFNEELAEKELRAINDEFNSILAEITGHSLSKIINDCSYNHWFTPEEAIKYGLIDYIIDESEFSSHNGNPTK